MVNTAARDKHVLKMTICKSSDSEDVQRIIAFAYLLINQSPCSIHVQRPRSLCHDFESILYLFTFIFYFGHEVFICTRLQFPCPKHTLFSLDTLLCLKFPMLLVSVNRGEAEDSLELVRPFFGSWWPSWSICYMTLTSLLFQVSDSPALFITP